MNRQPSSAHFSKKANALVELQCVWECCGSASSSRVSITRPELGSWNSTTRAVACDGFCVRAPELAAIPTSVHIQPTLDARAVH